MAKRKIYTLADRLSEYSSKDLYAYVRDLELKGYSHAKRDEMVKAIAEEMNRRNIIETRMLMLSDFQFEVLADAAAHRLNIDSYAKLDVISYLVTLELLGFVPGREAIYAVEEAAVLLKKDEDAAWHTGREKNAWLLGCAQCIRQYYLTAPVKVFARLAHRNPLFHESAADIAKQYTDLPKEMKSCEIEDGQVTFIERSIPDKEWRQIIASILKVQADKEFYIPEEEEIQELIDYGYPYEDPYIKEFTAFLLRNGMDEIDADKAASDIYAMIQDGRGMRDLLDYMNDIGMSELTDSRLEELSGLLAELNNNTRMYIHRGHTPTELLQNDLLGRKQNDGPAKIVPVSTLSAQGLQDNLDKLKDLGFDIDLKEQAAYMNVNGKMQKVYPNDPCPCGSGKLFKDCHGKEGHHQSKNLKN